jgi:hypothetical protein
MGSSLAAEGTQLTKVLDIKDLGTPQDCLARRGAPSAVPSQTCQAPPVVARGHGEDRTEMRPVVLDKLDAVLLLLPELEVAVEGGGNDEVGSARHCVSRRLHGTPGGRTW